MYNHATSIQHECYCFSLKKFLKAYTKKPQLYLGLKSYTLCMLLVRPWKCPVLDFCFTIAFRKTGKLQDRNLEETYMNVDSYLQTLDIKASVSTYLYGSPNNDFPSNQGHLQRNVYKKMENAKNWNCIKYV